MQGPSRMETRDVFAELTEDVIGRMQNGTYQRVREVMAILIRHLHAFVRESSLTQEEWGHAIDFLTRTGQMCSQHRQEFILLSDILGLSMLVDAVNHRSGVGITDSTVLGPFYAGPQRELAPGETIRLREKDSHPPVLSSESSTAARAPLHNPL